MPFWRTIPSMPLGRGKHETIGFLARTHTRTCTHTHTGTHAPHTHTHAPAHTHLPIVMNVTWDVFSSGNDLLLSTLLKLHWPLTFALNVCLHCIFISSLCINAQDDLSEFKLRKPQWWTLNQCYWPGEAVQIFSRVLITGNKKPLRQAGGSCLL